MADRRKIIVVSNRAPVSFRRGPEGQREGHRGGGGLVSALAPLVLRHEVTWIASAMSDEDRRLSAELGGDSVEERSRDGSSYRLRLVAHEPAAYEGYYNVISNPLLWFVQHHLWDLVRKPSLDAALMRAWHGGYVEVNRRFAEAVIGELDQEPGAAVFFHDYHLYLAPRFVREERPGAALSHFVHIPWPESEGWRVLADEMRVAIHDGLLASDVLGFHTERWRRNFVRSAADILGAEWDAESEALTHEGRRTLVLAHPTSVDVEEFEQLGRQPGVLEQEREIVSRRPERLIVRVERTDPSKNIVRGFDAYGLFLERHPELHGRVGMLALLDPSRQEIEEYARYLDEIQRAAEGLNSRFGRRDWQPVELRIDDNFEQSVAAYKQYDVLLVNAIFDGLNLVAKEAPLVNERDGVLVLSENAGAHAELEPWVVSINPFDLDDQAQAIEQALAMPFEERRRRIEGIREHVSRHDLGEWIDGQLAGLDRGVTLAAR
ncbi:MAG: alpha,alpha-trehalose-phosphate synthase (UDP-forming) [Gaiellaceae bacterium]